MLLAGRKRRSPTSQLKRAILTGKLTVAYQPVVELGSHRIVGAEALARWTDEDGDSIRPETIVALAEAEGFVSEITRFVLTRALHELRPVFEDDPNFQLSINLAPSDLADPRLLLLLDESLKAGSIEPANVAFELPERATFNRDVAVSAIRRLRDRGHAVYIDDFGTGYSNLAYLNELNVDGIKINRTFIATIGTDSVTASIVPQILAVAEALNLKVVVQGIEREEQASFFRADDPKMLAQGWFFGLPVPARSLLFFMRGEERMNSFAWWRAIAAYVWTLVILIACTALGLAIGLVVCVSCHGGEAGALRDKHGAVCGRIHLRNQRYARRGKCFSLSVLLR